jgi:hypothetical protein
MGISTASLNKTPLTREFIMKRKENLTGLEKDIEKLKAELDDRKAALPMHDATPQQWMAIEELEEEISRKKKALRTLTK